MLVFLFFFINIEDSTPLFVFADRQAVPAHLPLAWTHSSDEEIQCFITQLEALTQAVQSQHGADPKGPLDPSKPDFV